MWFLHQANLDKSEMSSPPFLRALMTAVCKAALKCKCLCVYWVVHFLHSHTNNGTDTFNLINVLSLSLPLPLAVCVGTCTGDSSSCKVDTAIIQKRLPVLHKYLNSDTERQLQALYALQALIVKLDQPPSKYKLSFQLCSILSLCSHY